MAWFISYMVVLYVPIVFSTWFYSETVQTLKHQIGRANDSLLQQIQETKESPVSSLHRIAGTTKNRPQEIRSAQRLI